MITYLVEYHRYLSLIGIAITLAIAVAASYNRSSINIRQLGGALLLHIILAAVTLKIPFGISIINAIASVINRIYLYAENGANFMFGSLATATNPWGFVFAFKVLPVIIFFGALMALLFHFKIIYYVSIPINKVLYPLLGTSAAETLCAVGNSFLGQTESPLLIRKYLAKMTESELFTVMVSGMATISGPLIAVYAALGIPIKYLLSASILAIPGSIAIAKIMMPETKKPDTETGFSPIDEGDDTNVFDALAEGTAAGLHLALAIAAMLIAFVSLMAAANGLLGWITILGQKLFNLVGIQTAMPALSLETILGTIFAPVGRLLGFSGQEMLKAGELLGIKITLNEMVAFTSMIRMHLSQRAIALMSFVLCGFANFSSIGIQIAGIGALAPNQKRTLAKLGLRAVLGATLVNIFSAFVAALFI